MSFKALDDSRIGSSEHGWSGYAHSRDPAVERGCLGTEVEADPRAGEWLQAAREMVAALPHFPSGDLEFHAPLGEAIAYSDRTIIVNALVRASVPYSGDGQEDIVKVLATNPDGDPVLFVAVDAEAGKALGIYQDGQFYIPPQVHQA